MAVALAALDAEVELYGGAGTTRSVAAAEFHRLPGDRPEHDTVIRPGEIITAVLLPAAPGAVSLYRKARERASYAFALASVAVVLDLDPDDGRVRRIALAFGGLAHRPWRAATAEARLTGAVPHRAPSARPSTPNSRGRGRCATTRTSSRSPATSPATPSPS